MNSRHAWISALRLALAGVALGALTVRADDIDDVLKVDRAAGQESVAQASADKPAHSAALPAETTTATSRTIYSGDSAVALRQKDVELEQARAEIDRLKRALVEQEARHQVELQRSYYNMGCVYKAAHQPERAESEFLKALAVNPGDAAVHYNLAILYDDDLHNKAKARQHFEKFLELAPDDRDAPLAREWLDTLNN